MAVAIVLSLVGAFGSGDAPVLLRTVVFMLFGLGSGLIVACSITALARVRVLDERPIMRRAAVGVLATVFVGLWVWAAMGFAFLHGPKIEALPRYLGYSLVLSCVMTTVSWAVFRERKTIILEVPAEARSKFLERLPARLWGAEVYAVQAEDHYLRLHTSKGSDLILMRLSDAITELQGIEGAQTHRSWWVAKAGVADIRRSEGRAVLEHEHGAEAPVSRTYARALRELGWI